MGSLLRHVSIVAQMSQWQKDTPEALSTAVWPRHSTVVRMAALGELEDIDAPRYGERSSDKSPPF